MDIDKQEVFKLISINKFTKQCFKGCQLYKSEYSSKLNEDEYKCLNECIEKIKYSSDN